MVAPCKDCERRKTGDEAGCHSGCPEYQEWKRMKDAAVDQRDREQKAHPELPRDVLRYIWREERWK